MSMEARRACPKDWQAIEELTQRVQRTLPRLWWWEEHLADDLFVVVEREGSVTGALLAWPDESSVAWARLAVLDDGLDIDEWLALTLPPVLDRLRRRETQSLSWVDYAGWAGPHLKKWGFRRLTDVITLTKFDFVLPDTRGTDARLRPATDADIPAVAAVDRAAFTPYWRHSEGTIRRWAAASPCFIVAEAAGSVVGYVEGKLRLPDAHLNRIALHPAHQGRGIGALLLRDALRSFWQNGARQVSLNTQADNHFSRQLYRHFGFESVGHAMTVWERQL